MGQQVPKSDSVHEPFHRSAVSGYGVVWLVILSLGFALIGLAIAFSVGHLSSQGLIPAVLAEALTLQFLPFWLRILLPLVAGLSFVILAFYRLASGQTDLTRDNFPEITAEKNPHFHEPHIVAIGGGTGLPSLLRGLKSFTNNITAIITVADDGGSSGRLRKELGLLPPGDFRNNLAALARDEALMTQVLQYRFGGIPGQNSHSELQGHAFGNLLLAALTGITGSFDEALLAAHEVLALNGQVLPSTLANVTLVADVVEGQTDGTERQIVGESAISEAGGRIRRIRLEPDTIRAYPPALKAIFQADLIIVGPGSLFTSILPNLLVPDLTEALVHARAPVIYVCNLATQPGETEGFTVADHVTAIHDYIPGGVINLVIANNNLAIRPDLSFGQTHFVEPLPPDGIPLKTADLVDEARPWRHDSAKLGQAIIEVLSELGFPAMNHF